MGNFVRTIAYYNMVEEEASTDHPESGDKEGHHDRQ